MQVPGQTLSSRASRGSVWCRIICHRQAGVAGMKFGVYIGPVYPGDMDGASAFDLARTIARPANESGFRGVFAPHHYSTRPSHTIFHPPPLLPPPASAGPEGSPRTADDLL